MRVKLAAFTAVALMMLALTSPAARTGAAAPAADATAEQLRGLMAQANAQLESSGAAYRVDYAEYMTTLASSSEAGQIVFFNDRGNKQIPAHFVPGDPRRGGATNITYVVDQAEGNVDALTTAQTTAAINRAMATWDGVNCSDIPITAAGNVPGDIGLVEFLSGLGGSPFVLADIQHAGWLPGGILPPDVIAVTFTFVFLGPGSVPTDIDNNGKQDVALREILYNNAFTWNINGNIDVETVALHESGHGLSQEHFGALFQTGNGKFHFSPRSVMNAGYTGVQQNLAGTDNGGHCSIWGSWPNN